MHSPCMTIGAYMVALRSTLIRRTRDASAMSSAHVERAISGHAHIKHIRNTLFYYTIAWLCRIKHYARARFGTEAGI